jgi:hypothetical protein
MPEKQLLKINKLWVGKPVKCVKMNIVNVHNKHYAVFL